MQAKYGNFMSYSLFFSLQFVGTVFLYLSYALATASIIPSHVITELSTILAKYFLFLELHVAGFQIHSFSHI